MVTSPGGVESARLFVRILPDTSVFARSLLRYLQRIEARTVVKLRTDLDGEHLIRQARQVADAAAHAAKVRLDAGVDAAGLVRDTRRAAALAGKSASVRVGLEFDPKRVASFATTLLGLVAAGAKLGILASLAAAAAVQFGHLAAALAPAAGAVAFLPAIALSAAAAIGTLQLAFTGFEDALKGDPEALARLAPAAREVVAEIGRLTPAWLDLIRAVQTHVFAGVALHVRQLAAVWLPLLSSQLSGIGQVWNSAFHDLAELLLARQTITDLTTVLGSAQQVAANLAPALRPVAEIFLNLAAVGAGFLPALAAGFTTAAQGAAAFIAQARESGQLATFFTTVGTTLAQIGRIAVQIGGILAAVFNAANVSGGGLLTNLETILSTVNAFLSAGEGQTALQGLFAAVQSVVASLLPILTGLIAAIGPGIAVLLGPDGLGGALRELAPAAKPVGQALGALAKALAPLLVLLGSVLADALTVLAGGLLAFATETGPLIQLVAQAGMAITQALMPALLALIDGALPNAIRLGQGLAAAFAPLVPIVAEMANVFITNALPAIEQLTRLSATQLIPAVIQAADQLGGALLDALRQLVPHVPALAEATVQAAIALAQLVVAFVPLIPLFAQALAWLIRLTSNDTGIRLLTFVLHGAAFWLGVVAGAIEVLVGWFVTATRWGTAAGAGIRDGFTAALNLVRTIPGQIGAVFAGAAGWLADAGRRIINGLIDGIQSQINKLKAKLRELTNLIPSWKGPHERDRRLLAPSGRLIMTGLVAGIVSQVPVLRAELDSITSGISHEFASGVDRVQPRLPSPVIAQLGTAARPTAVEPGAAAPPEIQLTALVRVGDGPVFEAVEAAVSADPARFAAHIRNGERWLTRRG